MLRPRNLLAVVALSLCVALLALPIGATATTTAGGCPVWLTAASTGSRHATLAVHVLPHGVSLGPTRALIDASVPTGGPASVLVEYGRDTSYGSCTSWVRNASDSTPAALLLKDLQPNADYHFRLVAKSTAGTVYGLDKTFTTLAGGTVPQGVKVGTIPIGGLQRAAALAVLARPLAAPLRLSYAGAFWHVTRTAAGASIDAKSALTAALEASPDATLPAAPVTIDPVKLGAFVTALSTRWGRSTQAATVTLHGRHAVVLPAKPGVAVDARTMTATITKALRSGETAAIPLSVKVAPVKKQVPVKAVVVRLGSQTLTAYLNGKPVLTTPVTTGRPALPTPVGSYFIHYRASPYTFISPWGPGSPYYYPPAHVTWAMYFFDNDFLHDDPGEPTSAFGAGSEYGPYASHGCVHVPSSSMAFLYRWLPVGAPVIVSQT